MGLRLVVSSLACCGLCIGVDPRPPTLQGRERVSPDPDLDRAQALFETHYPPLVRYCTGLCGDAELGKEVAAEAFTRLLARWTKAREPAALLHVIATNLIRRQWREAARQRRMLLDLSTTQAQAPTDSGLQDLVERLPQRLRVPVLLHYYADLPVEQVAVAVHRPAGTVRRWLAEGRALLRAELEESR